MRKMAVFFIFVFMIIVLVGAFLGQSLMVMQRIAHVSNVLGPVQVKARSQQEFRPLADARFVKAGDTLSTGPETSLALNWVDGTRIRVGPNTVMTVLQCHINKSTDAETSVFRLDLGQIWIRIIKVLSQQSKFEIRTPTATAGVRGTTFSVNVTEGGTEVSVYDGTVSVQTRSGSVDVGESKRLVLLGAAPQVVQFTPADRQTWDESIADLGPYLAIERPEPQETIRSGTVTVKGRCEQNAKLTINDRPVTPKPNGRFTVELPVSPQQPTFTVQAVATDVRGQSTTVTRYLNVSDLPATQ